MSFPRNVVGNLPHARLLCKKEKQLNLTQYEEDPRVLRTAASGMTACFTNGKSGRYRVKHGMTLHLMGFTLIELLVVVLIIGILAAVALPQYQKAVEKSKAAQAISLLRPIAQAAETYYLTNGTYPTDNSDIDALDIGLTPEQKTQFLCSDMFMECTNTGEWGISLNDGAADFHSTKIIRTTGKYAGAGFIIFQSVGSYQTIQPNTVYCYERSAGFYSVEKGSYCRKIFKGTIIPGFGANAYLFKLP